MVASCLISLLRGAPSVITPPPLHGSKLSLHSCKRYSSEHRGSQAVSLWALCVSSASQKHGSSAVIPLKILAKSARKTVHSQVASVRALYVSYASQKRAAICPLKILARTCPKNSIAENPGLENCPKKLRNLGLEKSVLFQDFRSKSLGF